MLSREHIQPQLTGEGFRADPFGSAVDRNVADILPEVQEARAMLTDFSTGRFETERAEAIRQQLSGELAADLGAEATADLVERGVKRPLLRQFDEDIEPRIRQSFAGLGSTFSSRRDNLVARELGRINDTTAEALARAQLGNQALQAQLGESSLNRQANAIALSNQFELAPSPGPKRFWGQQSNSARSSRATSNGAWQRLTGRTHSRA